MLRPTIVLLAALASPTALALAQEEDDEVVRSDQSQQTGKMPNPKAWRPKYPDLERDVELCSAWMEHDDEAFGLAWIPAGESDCFDESLRARRKREFDALVDKRRRWLQERRKEVDELVGSEYVHVETKHFRLAFGIPKIKVDRRNLSQFEAALLYARRLEAIHQACLDAMRITDREKTGHRYVVYVCERLKDANKICGMHLQNMTTGGNASLFGGSESKHCRYWDRERQRKDEDLHQSITYSVSQLVFDHVREKRHWLQERYGWVQVGLAHQMEIRLHGPPANWSFREQATTFEHWKSPYWEVNVRKAVLANDAPSFQDVIDRAVDTLDPRELQFCYSWVDYLLWLDPTKFDEMLGMMKGPQLPVRDCLQKAYGITVGQFVDGWQEFVKTRYSMTPRKKPFVRPSQAEEGSGQGEGGR